MSDETRNLRNRPVVAGASTSHRIVPPFEPNWISYRHSLVVVDVREDRGETVLVCVSCGCETDIVPEPHSPRCVSLVAAATIASGSHAKRRPKAPTSAGANQDQPAAWSARWIANREKRWNILVALRDGVIGLIEAEKKLRDLDG